MQFCLALGALPSFSALSTFRSLRALATRATTRAEGIVLAVHLRNAAAVTLDRRDVLDAATDALVALLVIADITKKRLAIAFLHGHVGVDTRLGANLGDTRPSRAEVGVERIKGIAEDGRVGKEDAGNGLGIDVVGSKSTAIRVLGNVDLRVMIGAEHIAFGLGRHRILGGKSRATGRRRAACINNNIIQIEYCETPKSTILQAKRHLTILQAKRHHMSLLTLSTTSGLAALQNSVILGENEISTGSKQGDGSNRGSRNLHTCVCILGKCRKMSFPLSALILDMRT